MNPDPHSANRRGAGQIRNVKSPSIPEQFPWVCGVHSRETLWAFRRAVQDVEEMCADMAYREMPQLGGLKLAFLIDPEGTRIELTEGLASQ
jgi:hypothetical protein